MRRQSFLFRLLVLRVPWVASATLVAAPCKQFKHPPPTTSTPSPNTTCPPCHQVTLPFFGDLAGLSGAIGFTCPGLFAFFSVRGLTLKHLRLLKRWHLMGC